MSRKPKPSRLGAVLAGLAAVALAAPACQASSAAAIRTGAAKALHQLLAQSAQARALAARARAVLVFPVIYKAGLLIGGQGGDGVLQVDGQTAGYYHLFATSYGLQVGAQKYSYALFFMNDGALSYLRKSNGWSVGVGPSVVLVDKGFARSHSSTTLTQDVYAVPFGQSGLMAGLGLEGSKITPIHPGK